MHTAEVNSLIVTLFLFFFFFKQKTAYEMRISDWSSDVCSSDLAPAKAAATIDGAGLFSIEEHTHTKKGFQMFIAIMGARVERETFAALLDAARALGGWYTKPWGGTPGGFAFKDAAMEIGRAHV